MSAAWQRDGYEAVIGLEIHVQLDTASKMFCACPNRYGDEPNTNVCMVCLAHPGALPVANAEAVRQSARVGLALGCRIPEQSEFSRKQYFYPDSPKAYQISQYDQPLCAEGSFHVPGEGAFTVRITRAHLEEDAAKMIHAGGDAGRISGSAGSVVDFNRAGTPLLEIVTEPDLRSPEQARRFLTLLRATVVAIGASDCDMEKGSLRADANVSIRPIGSDGYGTKAELKNMNSFRFLERGIEAELERQLGIVRDGGVVRQETLHFDPATGTLSSLRSKEEAHDYRYFPEPDLLPVTQNPDDLAALAGELPELPVARFARLSGVGLPESTALLLATEPELAAYYDDVAARVGDAKVAANWVLGEFQAHLNADAVTADRSPVTPERLAGLIALVVDGTINQTTAKEVLGALLADPAATAAGVVEERGLAQVGGADELGAIVDEVLAAHPDEAEAFRGGREQVIGFLVGQCMKASGGRADAKALQALLRERLSA